MVKVSFIILFLTNSLCVLSGAIFADRHSVVILENGKVQKAFEDIDDNKCFFEQCEKIAEIFASSGVPVEVADIIHEETQERIELTEQGKCIANYKYLGETLPLKDWTYDHIEKVLKIMAQMHSLNIQYPNYVEKKEDEIIKKSKNFSWQDSFYSENNFIKKNIRDTFTIERVQEKVKDDAEKLKIVNSAWFKNDEQIIENFWQNIATAGVTRDEIEKYINDFVSWLTPADDGHENQVSNPQQVLSLRNFEPQNIVWDEDKNPWIVGTSNFGFVDPKKEVINFAAVMSGFFHDQQNINWERFFSILDMYCKLNPDVGTDKIDVLHQLKNYLFNTKNVKYAFVKLNLELAKSGAAQNPEKLMQYAVAIQIGLRSLNDSWNNFGDIYFHLFP